MSAFKRLSRQFRLSSSAPPNDSTTSSNFSTEKLFAPPLEIPSLSITPASPSISYGEEDEDEHDEDDDEQRRGGGRSDYVSFSLPISEDAHGKYNESGLRSEKEKGHDDEDENQDARMTIISRGEDDEMTLPAPPFSSSNHSSSTFSPLSRGKTRRTSLFPRFLHPQHLPPTLTTPSLLLDSNNTKAESFQRKRRRRRCIPVLVVLIIVIVSGLAVGLGVGLSTRSDQGNKKEETDQSTRNNRLAYPSLNFATTGGASATPMGTLYGAEEGVQVTRGTVGRTSWTKLAIVPTTITSTTPPAAMSTFSSSSTTQDTTIAREGGGMESFHHDRRRRGGVHHRDYTDRDSDDGGVVHRRRQRRTLRQFGQGTVAGWR